MTKVTMPDPFTYVHPNTEKGPLFHVGQMEAYADARVRAALEEAAKHVAGRKAGRDGQATMLTELSKIERAIRALIPKEPPCET